MFVTLLFHSRFWHSLLVTISGNAGKHFFAFSGFVFVLNDYNRTQQQDRQDFISEISLIQPAHIQ